jgi:hypothetical protein
LREAVRLESRNDFSLLPAPHARPDYVRNFVRKLTNVCGFVRLQDGGSDVSRDSGTGGVTQAFRDGAWHFLAMTIADNGAN